MMSKISPIHFMFVSMYTNFPPDPFQEIILYLKALRPNFRAELLVLNYKLLAYSITFSLSELDR